MHPRLRGARHRRRDRRRQQQRPPRHVARGGAAPSPARSSRPRQGYGAAIRRGIDETTAFDLVCICEPDGTFDPDDLFKLLPFLSDAEVVFGSRTVTTFIFSGANMGPFLRWGNWAVAKLTEVLFNASVPVRRRLHVPGADPRRASTRSDPTSRATASSFGFEMMLHVVRRRISLVQVPVRYLPRVGESAVTGDFAKAFKLGMQMIAMAFRMRLRRP